MKGPLKIDVELDVATRFVAADSLEIYEAQTRRLEALNALLSGKWTLDKGTFTEAYKAVNAILVKRLES